VQARQPGGGASAQACAGIRAKRPRVKMTRASTEERDRPSGHRLGGGWAMETNSRWASREPGRCLPGARSADRTAFLSEPPLGSTDTASAEEWRERTGAEPEPGSENGARAQPGRGRVRYRRSPEPLFGWGGVAVPHRRRPGEAHAEWQRGRGGGTGSERNGESWPWPRGVGSAPHPGYRAGMSL
jgi:hypothetical protein